MYKADNTQPLTVMGLMSGTSVDGVDACLARLSWQSGKLHHDILATHSVPMPADLRERLLRCMAEKSIQLEEFCRLNVAVGQLFADTAFGLMQAHNISASQIDCIGSHGQTLYHWPPTQPGMLGGTLQIGEPSLIAEKTGVLTIADFRPRDMAAGGQGAPLVCFADQLLFQDDTVGRCVQNIGGIANVTVVPSHAHLKEHDVPLMAFDTGPGNMLMDAAVDHFYQKSYDPDGAIAASGTVNEPLLQHLMAHAYLSQQPPKTTGRELFGLPCFQELLLGFPNIPPADWLATLNRFTAASIVDAYQRFVFPVYPVSEVIVGGGGSLNPVLLNNLRDLFAQHAHAISVKTHADFGIPDQYKEALAFAILAWASLLNRANNLPACTGASHAVVMGKHVR
ncbi:anhydro-N-acetylmuramic acid kinase [Vampirovibrio sp.]|uniref:anhydro-N-acetylmuramic acid kinase n=1 Tax=Vampirovibrio sp. TaxID=2717857 RepID=UPI003593A024